jgi:urocanate hydratase
MGGVRHVDADYGKAIEIARENDANIPMLKNYN